MPGIAGALHVQHPDFSDAEKVRALLRYAGWYTDDPLFSDRALWCLRTHNGCVGEQSSPYDLPEVKCWVEGEAYNLPEIRRRFGMEAESFSGVLAEACQKGCLAEVLHHADAYFAAVLYEPAAQRVHLVSDRYGMKPLYYWQDGPHFAWASELKGFLAMPGFTPVIERRAAGCMMDLGQLLGDLTWFENVRLLDAATLLTYDLSSKKMPRKQRYWRWSDIPPNSRTFGQAVEEHGHLLKEAIRKRATDGKKICVALSGGLDSRALLAALHGQPGISAFTFGMEDSNEVKIARQVAALAGAPHHVLPLNGQNWLEKRFEGVWKTDGMMTLLHTHYSVHHEAIRAFCEVLFNGFAGDLIAGGSWIRQSDTRIGGPDARKYFGRWAELLDPADSFYDIKKQDPFFIDTRVRRFTNGGTIEFSKLFEDRRPFLDNELMAFLYGLPDDYRRFSRLYNATLLDQFPGYYRDIPWQRTGLPIRNATATYLMQRLKIKSVLRRLHLRQRGEQIVRYAEWLRQPQTASIFRELLDPARALYPAFYEDHFLKKYLAPHLSGEKDYSEQIARAATIEIWLRRVFQYKIY